MSPRDIVHGDHWLFVMNKNVIATALANKAGQIPSSGAASDETEPKADRFQISEADYDATAIVPVL